MDAKPVHVRLAACVCMVWLLAIWPALSQAGHEFDETIDTIKPEQVKLFLNAGEKLVLVDLRPVKEFTVQRNTQDGACRPLLWLPARRS